MEMIFSESCDASWSDQDSEEISVMSFACICIRR